MKIKIVKKLNFVLLVLVVAGALGLVSLYVVSEQENGRINEDASMWEKLSLLKTKLMAGKANQNSPRVAGEKASKDHKEETGEEGEDRVEIEEGEKVDPPKKPDPVDSLEEFSFVAIGDSEAFKKKKGYNKELERVLEKSAEQNPNFAVFTGDIIVAQAPSTKEIEEKIVNLKNKIEEHFNHYYIAFGNHDVECGTECVDLWSSVFFNKRYKEEEERKLYHSFDYGNTHFVLLSTSYPATKSVDDKQLAWLDKDLGETKKKHKIVIGHVSPITFFKEAAKRCHDMSCSPHSREKLLAILQKHKVDLVISGHENTFDHKEKDGIDFVLSGNVGNSPKYDDVEEGDIYSLFTISKDKIKVEAIKIKKKEDSKKYKEKVIDKVEIK